MSIQVTLLTITHIFSILQNDLNYEENVKQNYIQQCPNWYFVIKKENIKSIINKVTKEEM